MTEAYEWGHIPYVRSLADGRAAYHRTYPADVRPVTGRRELTKSLKTRDRAKIEVEVAKLNLIFDDHVAGARAGMRFKYVKLPVWAPRLAEGEVVPHPSGEGTTMAGFTKPKLVSRAEAQRYLDGLSPKAAKDGLAAFLARTELLRLLGQ